MSTDDFRVYLSAYHSEVTGSRLLLNAIYPDGKKQKILVDCGYYQEIEYRHLNYENELKAADIDAVLLTHNHLDHTGLVPKLVRDGYSGPIYMTNITRELIPGFWRDAASQQEENAQYLRKKYPKDASKFEKLYDESDCNKALNQSIGVEYREVLEILPGVKVTFYENGHLFGSACILVQFFCHTKKPNTRKPLNYFFTGDYRARNPLFYVPPLPKAIRKMEMNIVCESTYGSTESKDFRVCFEKNILEAISKKMNILIGAFAQGRMQEILMRFKIMQAEGKIPPMYEICVDGRLGIWTCKKYLELFQRYYPNAESFMPENVRFLDATDRDEILRERGSRKIVITTSGMLSNGPARNHVSNFIERFDCMIHICGYAAEETVARELLNTMTMDEVEIRGKLYQKNAIVKTTREFTSHATSDELMKFLRQFHNVRFVVVNHGATRPSREFTESIIDKCPNVEEAGRINRQTMFCFIQKAPRGADYEDIVVKAMPAKLKEGPAKPVHKKYRHSYKKDGRERRR